MMDFQYPWFLLLLLLVPLLAWRMYKRPALAVTFSDTSAMTGMNRTLKARLHRLPQVLRLLAVMLLVVSLAGPREGRAQTRIDSEGIAIQLLVDRSGSMRATDFKLQGRPVDRLAAIKNVASRFVLGDDQLDGRAADMVGLITFARYADNASPLTLDHAYLVDQLLATSIVNDRSEDGTAIGDAIGLGVERLRALEDSRQDSDPIPGKIIILLTDGENNAGDLEPLAAAELAKAMGVKIYTIGVGTRGMASVPVTDPFTGMTVNRRVPVNIDEDTLRSVAQATSGQYFRATDTDSLEGIYAQIDQLEKTRIEEQTVVDYRQLAIEPLRTSLATMPPLLLIVFALLAGELMLSHTWLRRLP